MQTGIPQSHLSCFRCQFFTSSRHCQGSGASSKHFGPVSERIVILNQKAYFISILNSQDSFPRINRACLFQGCRLMQNCICDKCKRNKTISSATPSVAGFHHCWVGNDDVQSGDKQIQDIHAICHFQVHNDILFCHKFFATKFNQNLGGL